MTDACALANSFGTDNSASFKFKRKITGKTADANGTKDVRIMVLLIFK